MQKINAEDGQKTPSVCEPLLGFITMATPAENLTCSSVTDYSNIFLLAFNDSNMTFYIFKNTYRFSFQSKYLVFHRNMFVCLL